MEVVGYQLFQEEERGEENMQEMEKWKRDGKEIFGEEERIQRIIEEETKRKKGRRRRRIEKVEEGSRYMKVY